eukprot:RCo020244
MVFLSCVACVARALTLFSFSRHDRLIMWGPPEEVLVSIWVKACRYPTIRILKGGKEGEGCHVDMTSTSIPLGIACAPLGFIIPALLLRCCGDTHSQYRSFPSS